MPYELVPHPRSLHRADTSGDKHKWTFELGHLLIAPRWRFQFPLNLLSRKNAAERVESSRKNIGVATKLENLMFAPEYAGALLTIGATTACSHLQKSFVSDLDLIFEAPPGFRKHDDKTSLVFLILPTLLPWKGLCAPRSIGDDNMS